MSFENMSVNEVSKMFLIVLPIIIIIAVFILERTKSIKKSIPIWVIAIIAIIGLVALPDSVSDSKRKSNYIIWRCDATLTREYLLDEIPMKKFEEIYEKCLAYNKKKFDMDVDKIGENRRRQQLEEEKKYGRFEY